MTRRIMIVLGVSLTLILAGCAKTVEESIEQAIERQLEEETGSGDVEIDLDEEGGSVSIETDEGSIQIGGAEIPDDFLLPIPDYNEISGVVAQTGEFASTMVSLTFDPDEIDEVAALYEDFFNDQGWETSRTDSTAEGGRMVIISGNSDELTASAIIGYTDGDDEASLTAQYSSN